MVSIPDDVLERFVEALESNARANGELAVTMHSIDSRLARIERHSVWQTRIMRDLVKQGAQVVGELGEVIDVKLKLSDRRNQLIALVIGVLALVALIVGAITGEGLSKLFVR